MDELKVQLESRQDLEYLRGELGKYLDDNAYTTTKEQRDRVPLFAILLTVHPVFGRRICHSGAQSANRRYRPGQAIPRQWRFPIAHHNFINILIE